MADIKWIKITTTMFDDEKIKLIEAMPDADSMLVIWIKLLTLAGRCNDSGDVTLSPNMPFTAEMLSTIFHRPLNTIRLALEILVKYEMIVISEKKIEILNWEKHQNIDGMELIKEQARLRNVKYRERKRLEQKTDIYNNDVAMTSRDGIDKIRIDKIRIDKKEPKCTKLSNEDFFKSLKSSPAYKGIDIDRELSKMDVWITNNPGRQKTRKFVTNWLNKIDAPLEVKKQPTLRSDKPYVKPEYR